MNSHFGPWTTAICDYGNNQLATFWKRRFQAIASQGRVNPANRVSSSLAVGVAILGFGLPTLLAEPREPVAQPASQTPATSPNGDAEALKAFTDGRADRLKLLEKNADPNAPADRRPDVGRMHSVDFSFGQPMAEAFEFLGDLYRVAIMLPPGDLPERKLTFSFTDKTISEALDIFCEHAGWEWDADGYIIYTGPEPAVNQFRRMIATRDERRRDYPAGLARRLQDRTDVDLIRNPLGNSIKLLTAVTNVPMRVSDPELAAKELSFSTHKTNGLPLDVVLDLLSLKYDLKWHIDDTGTVVMARKPVEQARLQDGPDDVNLELEALLIEEKARLIELETLLIEEKARLIEEETLPLDPLVPIEEQPLPILKRFERAVDEPAGIT